MSINRGSYVFSRDRRLEREHRVHYKCEECGTKTDLLGHHIISCYMARRNPVLIPRLIKKAENLMMLCEDCHEKADKEQKKWSRDEIGMMAWALFGLDPARVADAQWTTADEDKRKRQAQRKRRKRRRKKARKK